MQIPAAFFDFDTVSFWEAALRIFLASVLGMAIGVDRAIKGKPIDFRVYIIVATTACAMAMLSEELYSNYQTTDQTVSLDFTRIIAGVLTGIGFLGAGAIIRDREDEDVVGSATGACIWASGGMGLTMGYGFYGLTLITFIPIIVALVGLGYLTHEDREKS